MVDLIFYQGLLEPRLRYQWLIHHHLALYWHEFLLRSLLGLALLPRTSIDFTSAASYPPFSQLSNHLASDCQVNWKFFTCVQFQKFEVELLWKSNCTVWTISVAKPLLVALTALGSQVDSFPSWEHHISGQIACRGSCQATVWWPLSSKRQESDHGWCFRQSHSWLQFCESIFVSKSSKLALIASCCGHFASWRQQSHLNR